MKLMNATAILKRVALGKRIVMILLALVCGQLTMAAFAQKVTINRKGITLAEVFNEIKRQCNCDFFYNESLVKSNSAVDLNMQNATVQEVLDYCFKNQPLKYTIDNKTIVITAKPSSVKQQKVQVRGRVMDYQGKPLPGITVGEKDNAKNLVGTDVDGTFQISVTSGNATLVFKSLGYETLSVPLQQKTWLEVRLTPVENQLDDVVVTGYQKLEKKSLTGSIATVNMAQLETIFQPNIDKLLQGQVPGLTVMSTSGAPGAMPQIRIRGTATLSGNVQPLWVVDGIILDDAVNVSVDDIMTNRNLIASGIGGVNVEDIESINVLKDAAATAIYGTRAANGVIVITSKKGRAGKTRIGFTSNASFGERPRIEDTYMMNSKERIDVNLEMIKRGAFNAVTAAVDQYNTVSDFERYFIDLTDKKITWEEFNQRVNYLETVNTDWFKHLFRTSFSNRQNLSVSGGDEKTTFYASGSYLNDQATAKGVGQKTYTGSLKVYTKIYNKIRLGVMMDINARENNSFFAVDSKENPFEYAIYTTRAQPALNPDGTYSHFYLNEQKYNFLENRDKGWRDSRNFGLRGSVDLEYKVLKDVTFNSLFSYAKQNTTDEDIAVDDSYFVRIRKRNDREIVNGQYKYTWTEGGYRKDRSSYNGSITFRNQLTYNPMFKEVHYLNVMVGQEVRKSKTTDVSTEIYGYSHDRGHQQVPQYDYMKKIGVPYWKENLSDGANVSYLGAVNYTYDNRYTLSFNVRTDGSNRFGLKTNQLFQPLWAIGANYQMKEERFLRDVDWLSYLTLKGSYGSQGNVAAQAYSDLVANIGAVVPENPSNYLTIIAPKNPNLKWEQTYTGNVALEAGFFKRRLMFNVEWYNKKAMDLLGNRQVSQVTGFESVQVNWASMLNRGWEFSLNTINIDNEKFRWSSNINFGFNKNKVLDVYTKPTVQNLTNPRRSNYAATAIIGEPIDGLWSYRYAGLNEAGRATFYTAKEGEKVLYGMTNTNGLAYSGVMNPTSQVGFTNTFTYKRVTLSALFIGSFGNVMRLRNMSNGSYLGFPDPTQNMSKEWVNRWKNPGDEAHTNIPVLEVGTDTQLTALAPTNGTMFDNSDLRTVKGDFIRLQNVSISYDYFTPRLRALGVQNIRLALQGNNLHVWKDKALKGQDPEAQGSSVVAYSDTRNRNINFGNTFLPVPRSYSLSLSVQF
ncbi:SusC/RagA family TonB-linked outer membrane protein [Sphingobacterium psychroaquaticum]|uniref:TonB-linked outer membrane protein, SusC/RagA family n=1 Tax=Sphingobacterium psychroaquaticum TaxID=561061 RepID=A0A1X7JAY9_9SPHI|nr:SusC/RagA family TonB-linked outer membrane protein [Sphingobacterium psychroaquaticum]SMG24642.1 TonB-linked outer membrane protein, SusC/RagA family [Sphingobacterium psychroaquaticum]